MNTPEEILALLKGTEDVTQLNLNFYDPLVGAMKIYIDWLKVKTNCDSLMYSEIQRIYNSLLAHNSNIISIVLVGSVARGVYNDNSDIDIVVIFDGDFKEDPLQYSSPFRNVNIVFRNKFRFIRAYKEGKEFFVWSVKYGLLLYDRQFWINFFNSKIVRVNIKEIDKKRTYLNKLITQIYKALYNNDVELGIELIQKLVIQTSRLILISNNIIPKSRPELPSQLKEISSDFYTLYLNLQNLPQNDKTFLNDYATAVFDFMTTYVENHYEELDKVISSSSVSNPQS